jgi:CRISPR/Cas system Type II protein with McrA/HNH and RuvC-like nuclease domain
MSAEESLHKVESLLDRLEAMRTRLEATDDPEQAIELLQELADLDKEVQAELRRAREAAETDAADA